MKDLSSEFLHKVEKRESMRKKLAMCEEITARISKMEEGIRRMEEKETPVSPERKRVR